MNPGARCSATDWSANHFSSGSVTRRAMPCTTALPVVHRVVKDRAGVHNPVEVGDCEANRFAVDVPQIARSVEPCR